MELKTLCFEKPGVANTDATLRIARERAEALGIRQIVVESGPARLGRWVDFERDVQADFRLAFGRAPGALNSVGLLTDSNNTRTTAHAWYGPITLTVDRLTTAGRP